MNKLFIKILSIVLTIAFVAQDIAIAGGDSFLAPRSGAVSSAGSDEIYRGFQKTPQTLTSEEAERLAGYTEGRIVSPGAKGVFEGLLKDSGRKAKNARPFLTITDSEVLRLARKNFGIISRIAKEAGFDKKRLIEYLKYNRRLLRAIEAIREEKHLKLARRHRGSIAEMAKAVGMAVTDYMDFLKQAGLFDRIKSMKFIILIAAGITALLFLPHTWPLLVLVLGMAKFKDGKKEKEPTLDTQLTSEMLTKAYYTRFMDITGAALALIKVSVIYNNSPLRQRVLVEGDPDIIEFLEGYWLDSMGDLDEVEGFLQRNFRRFEGQGINIGKLVQLLSKMAENPSTYGFALVLFFAYIRLQKEGVLLYQSMTGAFKDSVEFISEISGQLTGKKGERNFATGLMHTVKPVKDLGELKKWITRLIKPNCLTNSNICKGMDFIVEYFRGKNWKGTEEEDVWLDFARTMNEFSDRVTGTVILIPSLLDYLVGKDKPQDEKVRNAVNYMEKDGGADFYTFGAEKGKVFDRIISHTRQQSGYRKFLLDYVCRNKNDNILSIGSGDALFESKVLEWMKAQKGNGSVTAVEINHSLAEISRLRGVETFEIDSANLSGMDSGSKDKVLFLESVGGMDLLKAFREAYRVLNDTGEIIVTSYNYREKSEGVYYYDAPSYTDVVEAMETAGFDVTRAEIKWLKLYAADDQDKFFIIKTQKADKTADGTRESLLPSPVIEQQGKMRAVLNEGLAELKKMDGGETLKDRVIWTGRKDPKRKTFHSDIYELMAVGEKTFTELKWRWMDKKKNDLSLAAVKGAVTDMLFKNNGQVISSHLEKVLKRKIDKDLDKEIDFVWIDVFQEGTEAGVFRVEIFLKNGERVKFGLTSAKNSGEGSKLMESDENNMSLIRKLYADFNKRHGNILPYETPQIYGGGYGECISDGSVQSIYMYMTEWLSNVYEVCPLLNEEGKLRFAGLYRGEDVRSWNLSESRSIRERAIMIGATIFELTEGKMPRLICSAGDILADVNSKGDVEPAYLIAVSPFNDVQALNDLVRTRRGMSPKKLSIEEKYIPFLLYLLNSKNNVRGIDDRSGVIKGSSIEKLFPEPEIVLSGIVKALIRMYGKEEGTKKAIRIFEAFVKIESPYREEAVSYLIHLKSSQKVIFERAKECSRAFREVFYKHINESGIIRKLVSAKDLEGKIIWTGVGDSVDLKRFFNIISVGKEMRNRMDWLTMNEKSGDLPFMKIREAVMELLLRNDGQMLSEHIEKLYGKKINIIKDIAYIWIDNFQEGGQAGVFRIEVRLNNGRSIVFGFIAAKNGGISSKIEKNDKNNLECVRRLYKEAGLAPEVPEVYREGYGICQTEGVNNDIYMFSVEWLDNIYEINPFIDIRGNLLYRGLYRHAYSVRWDLEKSLKIREKAVMTAMTIFELTKGRILRPSFSAGDITADINKNGEVDPAYLITIPYFCEETDPLLSSISRGEAVHSSMEKVDSDDRDILFLLYMFNMTNLVFQENEDGEINHEKQFRVTVFPESRIILIGIVKALIRLYGDEEGKKRAVSIFEKFIKIKTPYRKQVKRFLAELKGEEDKLSSVLRILKKIGRRVLSARGAVEIPGAKFGNTEKTLLKRIKNLGGKVLPSMRKEALESRQVIAELILTPEGQEKLRKAGFAQAETELLIECMQGRHQLTFNNPGIFWGALYYILMAKERKKSERKKFRLEDRPIKKVLDKNRERKILDAIKDIEENYIIAFHYVLDMFFARKQPEEIRRAFSALAKVFPFKIDTDNIFWAEMDETMINVFIPFECEGVKLGVQFCGAVDPRRRRFINVSDVLYEGEYPIPHQYIWGDAITLMRGEIIGRDYGAVFRSEEGGKRVQTVTPSHTPLREFVVSRVNDMGQNLKILSIGSGRGELESELLQAGHSVTCMDISEEAVRILKEKGFNTICGDAHNLGNIVKEKYDLVIFPESIGYTRREDVYNETKKVLSDTGKIIVLTYPENPEWFTPGYAKQSIRLLTDELMSAGFYVYKAIPIGKDQSKLEIMPVVREERAQIVYAEAGIKSPFDDSDSAVVTVIPEQDSRGGLLFRGDYNGETIVRWNKEISDVIRETLITIAFGIFESNGGKIPNISISGGDVLAYVNDESAKLEMESIALAREPDLSSEAGDAITFINHFLRLKEFPDPEVVFSGVTKALDRKYGMEEGLRRAIDIFRQIPKAKKFMNILEVQYGIIDLKAKKDVLIRKLNEVFGSELAGMDISKLNYNELILALVIIYDSSQAGNYFVPSKENIGLMLSLKDKINSIRSGIDSRINDPELQELAADYFAYYFYLIFHKRYVMGLEEKDKEKRHKLITDEFVKAPIRAAKSIVIEPKDGEIILDAGTGFSGMQVVSEAEDKGGIWLLDNNPFVVKVLGKYADLTGKSNIRVIEDDITAFSKIGDSEVSGIIAEQVLNYKAGAEVRFGTEKIGRFLREARRILKDNGTLTITYSQTPSNVKRFREAGEEVKRKKSGIEKMILDEEIAVEQAQAEIDKEKEKAAARFDESSSGSCKILLENGLQVINKKVTFHRDGDIILVTINAGKAGQSNIEKKDAGEVLKTLIIWFILIGAYLAAAHILPAGEAITAIAGFTPVVFFAAVGAEGVFAGPKRGGAGESGIENVKPKGESEISSHRFRSDFWDALEEAFQEAGYEQKRINQLLLHRGFSWSDGKSIFLDNDNRVFEIAAACLNKVLKKKADELITADEIKAVIEYHELVHLVLHRNKKIIKAVKESLDGLAQGIRDRLFDCFSNQYGAYSDEIKTVEELIASYYTEKMIVNDPLELSDEEGKIITIDEIDPQISLIIERYTGRRIMKMDLNKIEHFNILKRLNEKRLEKKRKGIDDTGTFDEADHGYPLPQGPAPSVEQIEQKIETEFEKGEIQKESAVSAIARLCGEMGIADRHSQFGLEVCRLFYTYRFFWVLKEIRRNIERRKEGITDPEEIKKIKMEEINVLRPGNFHDKYQYLLVAIKKYCGGYGELFRKNKDRINKELGFRVHYKGDILSEGYKQDIIDWINGKTKEAPDSFYVYFNKDGLYNLIKNDNNYLPIEFRDLRSKNKWITFEADAEGRNKYVLIWENDEEQEKEGAAPLYKIQIVHDGKILAKKWNGDEINLEPIILTQNEQGVWEATTSAVILGVVEEMVLKNKFTDKDYKPRPVTVKAIHFQRDYKFIRLGSIEYPDKPKFQLRIFSKNFNIGASYKVIFKFSEKQNRWFGLVYELIDGKEKEEAIKAFTGKEENGKTILYTLKNEELAEIIDEFKRESSEGETDITVKQLLYDDSIDIGKLSIEGWRAVKILCGNEFDNLLSETKEEERERLKLLYIGRIRIVIETYYRFILDGKEKFFPEGFWQGESGMLHRIILIRYLFENVLKLTINKGEKIDERLYGKGRTKFFKEQGVTGWGPLLHKYHLGKIKRKSKTENYLFLDIVKMAYPWAFDLSLAEEKHLHEWEFDETGEWAEEDTAVREMGRHIILKHFGIPEEKKAILKKCRRHFACKEPAIRYVYQGRFKRSMYGFLCFCFPELLPPEGEFGATLLNLVYGYTFWGKVSPHHLKWILQMAAIHLEATGNEFTPQSLKFKVRIFGKKGFYALVKYIIKKHKINITEAFEKVKTDFLQNLEMPDFLKEFGKDGETAIETVRRVLKEFGAEHIDKIKLKRQPIHHAGIDTGGAAIDTGHRLSTLLLDASMEDELSFIVPRKTEAEKIKNTVAARIKKYHFVKSTNVILDLIVFTEGKLTEVEKIMAEVSERKVNEKLKKLVDKIEECRDTIRSKLEELKKVKGMLGLEKREISVGDIWMVNVGGTEILCTVKEINFGGFVLCFTYQGEEGKEVIHEELFSDVNHVLIKLEAPSAQKVRQSRPRVVKAGVVSLTPLEKGKAALERAASLAADVSAEVERVGGISELEPLSGLDVLSELINKVSGKLNELRKILERVQGSVHEYPEKEEIIRKINEYVEETNTILGNLIEVKTELEAELAKVLAEKRAGMKIEVQEGEVWVAKIESVSSKYLLWTIKEINWDTQEVLIYTKTKGNKYLRKIAFSDLGNILKRKVYGREKVLEMRGDVARKLKEKAIEAEKERNRMEKEEARMEALLRRVEGVDTEEAEELPEDGEAVDSERGEGEDLSGFTVSEDSSGFLDDIGEEEEVERVRDIDLYKVSESPRLAEPVVISGNIRVGEAVFRAEDIGQGLHNKYLLQCLNAPFSSLAHEAGSALKLMKNAERVRDILIAMDPDTWDPKTVEKNIILLEILESIKISNEFVIRHLIRFVSGYPVSFINEKARDLLNKLGYKQEGHAEGKPKEPKREEPHEYKGFRVKEGGQEFCIGDWVCVDEERELGTGRIVSFSVQKGTIIIRFFKEGDMIFSSSSIEDELKKAEWGEIQAAERRESEREKQKKYSDKDVNLGNVWLMKIDGEVDKWVVTKKDDDSRVVIFRKTQRRTGNREIPFIDLPEVLIELIKRGSKGENPVSREKFHKVYIELEKRAREIYPYWELRDEDSLWQVVTSYSLGQEYSWYGLILAMRKDGRIDEGDFMLIEMMGEIVESAAGSEDVRIQTLLTAELAKDYLRKRDEFLEELTERLKKSGSGSEAGEIINRINNIKITERKTGELYLANVEDYYFIIELEYRLGYGNGEIFNEILIDYFEEKMKGVKMPEKLEGRSFKNLMAGYIRGELNGELQSFVEMKLKNRKNGAVTFYESLRLFREGVRMFKESGGECAKRFDFEEKIGRKSREMDSSV